MLALILAMLFCVAIGAGVVGYVMLEARREGRGEFWTAEGEELIAGARRTGEKVRTRGERLGRTAAERTRDLAARRSEAGARPDELGPSGATDRGTTTGGTTDRGTTDRGTTDRGTTDRGTADRATEAPGPVPADRDEPRARTGDDYRAAS